MKKERKFNPDDYNIKLLRVDVNQTCYEIYYENVPFFGYRHRIFWIRPLVFLCKDAAEHSLRTLISNNFFTGKFELKELSGRHLSEIPEPSKGMLVVLGHK